MSRSSRHASTPADWSSARVSTGEPLDRLTPSPVGAPGLRALVAEGWLYAAHDNGTLVRYSLSGDIFSEPRVVDGHGLEAFSDELTRMTSMFTADGQLYYTLAGAKKLFVRAFSVQSEVVGAVREDLPDTGLALAKMRGGFDQRGSLPVPSQQRGSVPRRVGRRRSRSK